ncbi:MAG: FG-GAP repeat protein [Planctomycetales bacterium]|nr:FG-GAP repeat protein [Planctomycetales bacterium]
MSLRNISKRCAARRSSVGLHWRRRVLVEQLESRQLLASDGLTTDLGFVDSLPTAEEAQFGNVVLTDQGREVCLAFMATGLAEGEDPVESLNDPGPVDLSAVIVQPTGPLAQGAAFTSEITFENAGPNDAIATDLGVTFDAKLAGITWEREIIRAQPATVAVADLDGGNGLAVQGTEVVNLAGFSVSGGGDFNDDGIDDFIVGATSGAGKVHVVFGTTSGFPANISLDTLTGTNGFTFVGSGAGSGLGTSLDNAGDVNDDGIDDLIVGAPNASSNAGEAFVIFGRSTFPASISASTMLATDGFKVTGVPAGFNLGSSVAGAGDVNDDGISDIIVGASGKSVVNPAGPPDNLSQGASYVIFGRAPASPFGASVDVTGLSGTNGFGIVTSDVNVNLGLSVSGAVDINHDGVDDVIVGSPDSITSSGNSKVHVIFGKAAASTFSAEVNVSGLTGSDGFTISAPRSGHLFGGSVAGVGDVNGDGIDDLVASDGINTSGASTVAAQSYVVFGSGSAFSSTLDISALNGTTGVVIQAPVATHPSSMKVSDAGDINGDGVKDLLIGLPAQMDDAVLLAGGGYVVFGSSTGIASPLNLSALNGTNGFLIEGRGVGGLAGRSIGAAGDVNGDGLADVIVGAPFESPGGTAAAGESYVVFGRGSTFANGAGAINETLDLFPGDKVIYRVSATIAPAATGSTVVNATTTVGPGVSDTNNANDSASATTLIASAAPTVESIVINDGVSPSRSQITSVTVTFDSVVDHGLLNNAFTLTQIDSNTQVGTVNVSPDSTSGKTVATLTFDGASTVTRLGTGPLGNSLADGNYRLVIDKASVVAGGTAMNADATDDFFRWYGDINGDRFVSTPDFGVFGPALGTSSGNPLYNASLDANGDGFITTPDFGAFGPKLGTFLPPS